MLQYRPAAIVSYFLKFQRPFLFYLGFLFINNLHFRLRTYVTATRNPQVFFHRRAPGYRREYLQ